MAGVKPKMKSNAWKYVLLFLFVITVKWSAANDWPMPDTIIIDGDVIYIEQNEDLVDMDSLEEAGKEDLIKKTVATFPWSIGVFGGYNLSLASFGTSVSDYTPLNIFNHHEKSAQFNPTYGIDLSRRFWSFPAMSGNMELGAHAGVAMNGVSIACDGLNPDSLIRDSLILLRYTDNEIYLEYFDRFEPPNDQWGELDTAIIGVQKNVLKYKTIDLPIRLRLTYTPNKSLSSFFIEAGVVKRIVMNDQDMEYANYLVNSSGRYIEIPAKDFIPKDLIRPVFALGAERKLEGNSGNAGAWHSIGAVFNTSVPSTAANTGSLFYVDFSNLSLTIFWRLHF